MFHFFFQLFIYVLIRVNNILSQQQNKFNDVVVRKFVYILKSLFKIFVKLFLVVPVTVLTFEYY